MLDLVIAQGGAGVEPLKPSLGIHGAAYLDVIRPRRVADDVHKALLDCVRLGLSVASCDTGLEKNPSSVVYARLISLRQRVVRTATTSDALLDLAHLVAHLVLEEQVALVRVSGFRPNCFRYCSCLRADT